jgi:hypothetical protein
MRSKMFLRTVWHHTFKTIAITIVIGGLVFSIL